MPFSNNLFFCNDTPTCPIFHSQLKCWQRFLAFQQCQVLSSRSASQNKYWCGFLVPTFFHLWQSCISICLDLCSWHLWRVAQFFQWHSSAMFIIRFWLIHYLFALKWSVRTFLPKLFPRILASHFYFDVSSALSNFLFIVNFNIFIFIEASYEPHKRCRRVHSYTLWNFIFLDVEGFKVTPNTL